MFGKKDKAAKDEKAAATEGRDKPLTLEERVALLESANEALNAKMSRVALALTKLHGNPKLVEHIKGVLDAE
jgi:hypothetical protein